MNIFLITGSLFIYPDQKRKGWSLLSNEQKGLTLNHYHTYSEGLAGFWSSGPVATLAGVIVDETRLATVKVSIPLEALEVGGLIS